jgi:hypothetical protein
MTWSVGGSRRRRARAGWGGASDRNRMLEALERGTMLGEHCMVATSLATQALLPAGTGRVQMESVPLLSSQDGSRRVQMKDFGPTRNRKVVGSNPTSGSKTAAQRPFRELLAAQR